jgi:propionyl-CoA carboxylase alpha chain
VEARLYAEDPSRDWQPQAGTLHALSVAQSPGLRLDSGYAAGDAVGVHYDPMLAKVIAHAPTRAEAVRKLAHALERARIHGPVTNRDLLVRSLRHPDFAAGRLDTGFYDRHLDALTEASADSPRGALAALAATLADAAARQDTGTTTTARLGGWRNVASQPQVKTYRAEPHGTEHEIRYRATRNGFTAEGTPGVRVHDVRADHVTLEIDGVLRHFQIAAHASGRTYVDTSTGGSYTLTALPRFPDPTTSAAPGSLLAPMPGTVVRVSEGLVEGAHVTAGQPLLWLEAMKMEHRISSPASGTLTALHAVPGRQVEVGALLAVVQEVPEAQEDIAS